MPDPNPEGHSPRYWRKHRKVKVLESNPTPQKKPAHAITVALHFILTYLWSWTGVLALATFSFAAAVNAMYSKDYISAAILFLVGIALICAKAFAAETTTQHENHRAIRAVIVVLGVVIFSSFSAWDWRVYRRLEIWNSRPAPSAHVEPWSLRVSSLVTNRLLPLWTLDSRNGRQGYFCRVPIVSKVYLTNNQTHWSMITRIRVEAEDTTGHWIPLRVINTELARPLYGGKWGNARRTEPMDGKYFDQEVVSKNIGPGETKTGWLFLDDNSVSPHFITGPLKVSVTDLDGGFYETRPQSASDVLEGAFSTLNGVMNLSKLKREDCPIWEGW